MHMEDYSTEVEEMVRILDYDVECGRDPFSIDGNACTYYHTIKEQHDEQLANLTWYTAYGIFKANNQEWFANNVEVA